MEWYNSYIQEAKNVPEVMKLRDFIYDFREQLDRISALFPVIALLGSGIILGAYVIVGSESEWLMNFDYILRSIFDCSWLMLLLMFCKSRNYRFTSWLALICLFFIWLLNMVYFIFDFKADIYFMLFISSIYAIFVITTVAKLTNRC